MSAPRSRFSPVVLLVSPPHRQRPPAPARPREHTRRSHPAPHGRLLGLFFLLLGTVLVAGPARAECTDYAEGIYSIGGVDTPGYARDVAVSGQHAVVAAGCSGLQVIDLSDPISPSIVGSLDTVGMADGIEASDSLVFLADAFVGLRIINVSDPTAPQLISSLGADDAGGVAIEGTTVYLTFFDTTSHSGIYVIDASNPASPQYFSSITIGGHPEKVAVSGGIVCLANGTSLCVIDATAPSAPVLVSTLSITAYGVTMEGDTAYVACGSNGLCIVDLSNPALPQIIGSVALPGFGRDVEVSGARAYVAAGTYGLEEIDISEPSAPELVREVPTICTAWGVAMAGPLACVAANLAGLRVIDTQNYPPDPGHVFLPGYGDAVEVAGNIAYVGVSRPHQSGTGLYLVDISDPAAPSLRGVYLMLWDYVADVAASGGYAYVMTNGDGAPGLHIVDVSNPDAPSRLSSIPLIYPPYGYYYPYQLVVAEGYAYVANGYAGMMVVRVENPSAPVVISQLAMPTTTYGVGIEGRYAFVLHKYGLVVVDVQDPAHPQIVTSVDTPPGTARGLRVQNGWAYVSGSFGLEMIDVRNPIAPQVAGQVAGSGGPRVACAGSYAYALWDYRQLRVINIADASLIPVGYATALQEPRAIAATMEHVFIGDDTGLRIFPAQCEPSGVGTDALAGAPGTLRILPNPVVGEVMIQFALDRAVPARLGIFDVAGRPVRRLLDTPLPAGNQSIRWDGRDDAGRPLPAGVYLTKLLTASGTQTGRAVLVR